MAFIASILVHVLTLFQLPILGKSLTLVSDLPTPSFLIDMDMLHKAALGAPAASKKSNKTMPLYLPKYKNTLFPYSLGPDSVHLDSDSSNPPKEPYDVGQYKRQISALGYLHSSVTRARHDKIDKNSKQERPESSDIGTFLAELDLGTDLCCPETQLAMGINNHHVGSYYWARSVGMGASMEAPGISFRANGNGNGDSGILCWQGDGPLDCNSNDGKRSEWVNFLRAGDLVQLLPGCFEDDIMAFVERFQGTTPGDDCRIYGFSSEGRPLGSEPMVVCQWRKQEIV